MRDFIVQCPLSVNPGIAFLLPRVRILMFVACKVISATEVPDNEVDASYVQYRRCSIHCTMVVISSSQLLWMLCVLVISLDYLS